LSGIHSPIDSASTTSLPLVVLHSFSTWLPLTQIWMYNLVRFLPRDVEAHILSETTENIEQFRLPNIHPLSGEPGWIYRRDYLLRFLKIRRHLGFLVDWATRVGANLLHSHFGNIGWTNLDAARKARLKHVVSFYGFDASYLPSRDAVWRRRYLELFQRADLFLCEGAHMANCVAALGCPREKIRVHHLGVRTEEIAFRPRSWDPSTPLRVLIAASFQEKKGIPDAIDALGRLRKHTHLDVTIIGDANEEPRSRAEKRNILDAIDRNGLRQHTRLLGYRSHAVLLEVAYVHHLFLSPSITARDGDTEGGAPVTLIEMCATGMPVVSTRHCDIPEVVRDGITGLLAGERDIEGLADRMSWLISNPDRWFSMAEAGRKHIESNYDARTQGTRLGRLYRELHG
jgi:colanic acid/amylovoran biosynthesis glycosyltransferase